MKEPPTSKLIFKTQSRELLRKKNRFRCKGCERSKAGVWTRVLRVEKISEREREE